MVQGLLKKRFRDDLCSMMHNRQRQSTIARLELLDQVSEKNLGPDHTQQYLINMSKLLGSEVAQR